MANCGGYFSQHVSSLYGDDFCVECSLQALQSDPDAMLEPLQAKLRKHPLNPTCACRIIQALMEITKPLTFPLQHIPTIVKAVEAVLMNLPREDSWDASCALLSLCLDITGQVSGPRLQLALSMLSDCLLVNKERIELYQMVQPGRLSEILCCGKLSRDLRISVLKIMQDKSFDPLLVLNKCVGFLLSENSPESSSAILESISYLLYVLPKDQRVNDLLGTKILPTLTRCLGYSADPHLQSCVSLVILGVLSRNSAKATSQLLNSDLCDAIGDVLLSKNHRAVQTLLNCIGELSDHVEFHSLQWSSRFVRCILLHMTMLEATDNGVFMACLHTLLLIFYHSIKFKKDAVGNNFENVFKVLKVGLDSSSKELREMARLASIHFLAAKQLAAIQWAEEIIPFAKFVAAVDSEEKTTQQNCQCFQLQLANSLISWCSAPGEDSKEKVELEKLILDSVVDHTKKCVLVNGYNNPWTYYNLLKVVDSILQEEKVAHIRISLAKQLASLNFISYAFFLPKQGRGYGRCYEVVFQIVNLLCSEHLETNLTFESFKETAQLIYYGIEKSKIFEDAAKFEVLICLLYLDTFYFDYFKRDLQQYSNYIEDHVKRSNLHLLRATTKAIIFLYACGKLLGPTPQFVFKLINRWAAIPHKIYTNHVAFVKWVLEIEQGLEFQKVQSAVLGFWLSNNPDAKQLKCTPQSLHAFLTVMVENPDLKAARAAHDAISYSAVNDSSDRNQLLNQLWQNLPLYLTRASGQDADGHFGHAFLLGLAVVHCPEHPNVIPVEALSTLVPQCLLSHTDSTDDKKWSLAILQAGFATLENLIVVLKFQIKSTEMGTQIFLQNKQLLALVQASLNRVPVSDVTFAALRFATALLAQQKNFNEFAQQPAMQITVKPKVLLPVILDFEQIDVNIMAVNFISSVALSAHSTSKTKPVVTIGLLHKNRVNFSTDVYKLLHVLIAEHPGSSFECAAWSCLRSVLEWNLDKWLCHLPWTHTLLWTKQVSLLSADCARQMLLFLHCLFQKLHQSHREKFEKTQHMSQIQMGSDDKMSNKTAQFLLSVSEYLAFELDCKAELCSVFKVLLEMEYELQPEVCTAVGSKLNELQFSA